MKTKAEIRNWRKKRIRKKIRGDANRPRLSVFRSATHIYAQIINDDTHTTLISASSLSEEIAKAKDSGDKSAIAKSVGSLVAKKCIENNIKKVIFDRNGFVYHGRIQALAEGARESGLEF